VPGCWGARGCPDGWAQGLQAARVGAWKAGGDGQQGTASPSCSAQWLPQLLGWLLSKGY